MYYKLNHALKVGHDYGAFIFLCKNAYVCFNPSLYATWICNISGDHFT